MSTSSSISASCGISPCALSWRHHRKQARSSWGKDECGEAQAFKSTFKAIAAGEGFTCGIREDDKVVCRSESMDRGSIWIIAVSLGDLSCPPTPTHEPSASARGWSWGISAWSSEVPTGRPSSARLPTRRPLLRASSLHCVAMAASSASHRGSRCPSASMGRSIFTRRTAFERCLHGPIDSSFLPRRQRRLSKPQRQRTSRRRRADPSSARAAIARLEKPGPLGYTLGPSP